MVAGPVFAGRSDGPELQSKRTTAIIPYNEKVTVHPLDKGEINTGFLVKVSDTIIYLNDTKTGELVTISKNQVEQIRARAVTRSGKNFAYGFSLGTASGSGQMLHDAFGLVNMLNKIYQVSQTDVFLINNNNWEFVTPQKQRVGLLKKMLGFSFKLG